MAALFDWQVPSAANQQSNYIFRYYKKKSLFICDELHQRTHFIFGALMIPSTTISATTTHPCVCLAALEIYCPTTGVHLSEVDFSPHDEKENNPL